MKGMFTLKDNDTTWVVPVERVASIKITAKKTSEWLKLCHDHAFSELEGEILELWQTPEGKLFFKKGAR